MAQYRQRLKDDKQKYEEALQRDREPQRIAYKKKKMSLGQEKKEELMERNRQKQQRFRDRKKTKKLQSGPGTNSIETAKRGTYKCPQTFGKALRKAIASLPQSPTKRRAVVQEIMKETLPEVVFLYPENKESRKSSSPNDEVKQIVQEFYCNDAISRQAPGKRDVKSVKDPTTGKREKIAIRHMLMNIMDAYFKFTKQHPQVKCSKTLFFKHRQQYVLPA